MGVLVVGFIFGAVAVMTWKVERDARAGVEIQGTVVDEVRERDPSGGVGSGTWRYAPKVEYVHPETGAHETQLFERFSRVRWHPGQAVTLRFHPESRRVTLPTRRGYLAAAAFAAVAVFCVYVAFV